MAKLITTRTRIADLGKPRVITGDGFAGHPVMAPPAIRQDRQLARTLRRHICNQPVIPFKYFDKATIGRNRAVVDLAWFRFQGFFAWWVWMPVHLLNNIGFKNKVLVMFSWLWSYRWYDKSNRLIMSRNREGVS